jgi:hypothetical protein
MLFAAFALASCYEPAKARTDGGASDSRAADGGAPDGTSSDAPAASTYNDLGDRTKWATFDLTSVNGSARGFRGAAFDGRYVYFVPSDDAPPIDGVVARFDTQGNFAAGTSWSFFDATTVNTKSQGFVGATFDGRYVYLVPFSNAYGVTDGVVTRYDTQASFTSGSSWSTFDTATVNASATGFSGAAFDGRYVYFAPNYNGVIDGVIARYDTQATFASSTSWSTFDITSVDANAKGFPGAVFDGRYLYLVPGDARGLIARYDTQAPFATATSWATFDTTNVDANAKGFHAGAFDGRYLYFTPWYNGTAIHGVVARYDSQASFGAASSWSTFDTTTLNSGARGFLVAAFDGRYLYLEPYYNTTYDGVVPRYDTLAPFASAASWSTFDIATVNAKATGFYGAAFDGRYLYFVPNGNGASGTTARFDARQPAALPRLCANAAALYCFSGSFY